MAPGRSGQCFEHIDFGLGFLDSQTDVLVEGEEWVKHHSYFFSVLTWQPSMKTSRLRISLFPLSGQLPPVATPGVFISRVYDPIDNIAAFSKN